MKTAMTRLIWTTNLWGATITMLLTAVLVLVKR
jgi:hypothetical protein